MVISLKPLSKNALWLTFGESDNRSIMNAAETLQDGFKAFQHAPRPLQEAPSLLRNGSELFQNKSETASKTMLWKRLIEPGNSVHYCIEN